MSKVKSAWDGSEKRVLRDVTIKLRNTSGQAFAHVIMSATRDSGTPASASLVITLRLASLMLHGALIYIVTIMSKWC